MVAVLLVRRLASVNFDWRLAGSSVRQLRWEWAALSLVPAMGTYYGRALRWAVFLRPFKPRPSMRNLVSATVIGFAAITVFGRPGEFVRPYLIAVRENVPLPSQLGAWLLERIFDLLMVLLIFGFALMRLYSSGARVGPRLAWVLVAGGRVVTISCIVILLLVLSMRHFAEPFQRRLTAAIRFLPAKKFQRGEHLISTFVRGIASIRSDAALFLVFVYSVVEWAMIAAVYWCLANSYSAAFQLSFSDVLIFLGFVSFGAIVQIPGVGGGVQVVTVVVLTELFHVKLEVASSFALVSWILTFVVIVPIGGLVAVKEGLDWRSLQRLRPESI